MDIDTPTNRPTNRPATDRSSSEPESSGMPAKKSTREAGTLGSCGERGRKDGRSGLFWSVPSAILPAAAGEVTELSELWRRWRQRVVPCSASVYETVLRPLAFARISKLQKSAIVCYVCTPMPDEDDDPKSCHCIGLTKIADRAHFGSLRQQLRRDRNYAKEEMGWGSGIWDEGRGTNFKLYTKAFHLVI